MLRVLPAALVLVVLLAAPADAALYRATFSGTQELTWKVDGTTTGCETRRGAGEGTVRFTVRSDKAVLLHGAAKRLSLLGSIPSTARGSIAGRFTDTVATACPGNEPGAPVTADAAGCGARRFGIRVDAKPVGAFTYLTGPSTPLQTGSIAQAVGDCPTFTTLGITSTSDLTACGDGEQQHRRSWGVASADGQGLFATRLSAAQTRPLRRGASRRLTGRTVVDCTVPSQYSGGVKLSGVLKYTLTVRRTS